MHPNGPGTSAAGPTAIKQARAWSVPHKFHTYPQFDVHKRPHSDSRCAGAGQGPPEEGTRTVASSRDAKRREQRRRVRLLAHDTFLVGAREPLQRVLRAQRDAARAECRDVGDAERATSAQSFHWSLAAALAQPGPALVEAWLEEPASSRG